MRTCVRFPREMFLRAAEPVKAPRAESSCGRAGAACGQPRLRSACSTP